MKLVKYDDFVKLPSGTVYSCLTLGTEDEPFDEAEVEGLYLKGDSFYRDDGTVSDFTYKYLLPEVLRHGTVKVSNIYERDGDYQESHPLEYFIVYDAEYISSLVKDLTECI